MSDSVSTKKDSTRKWMLVINNPIEKGWTHDKIKEVLETFKLDYWCMSDETGGSDGDGTFHTHIFMYRQGPIRRRTIETRFPSIHWDMCKGTAEQCRAYVFKIGKWQDSEKGMTNHRDSHEEFGELPFERQGARNDLTDLYDMIKEGLTTYEILESAPQYITQIDKIDKVRQAIKEEEYKNTWRDLEVTYVWGITGSGKTRSIMEEYGYSNVYRVTDYTHPFDAYRGQDVIVFEEFRSSLRLDDMLKYLDGYPVEFPARYNNKVACFTKVYIVTNIDIRKQYPHCQMDEPMTWNAFLRRIHNIKVFTENGIWQGSLEKYLDEKWYFFKDTPFDGRSNGNESA